MNLIQQAEQLKNLPDQALGQMQQNPTTIPPYLVLAEMQRRESMRKAFQASGDPVQQRTVAEEMRDKFNPAPPQMPQQQGPPQAQMPSAPPMRMAEGGLASILRSAPPEMEQNGGLYALLSGLGGLPPIDAGMANPQYPGAPPMGTFDDEPAMNMTQLDARYGKAPSIEEARLPRDLSRLKAIAEQLAEQEKGYRDKKPKLGQILMQLGLGMAASRRPDFAGAVGEGGLAALQGYTQQREGNLTRADNTMRQRLGLAEAMQQSDDVAVREAGELHRANIAGRNTAIMTGENARRGMQGDKVREKINELNREAQREIESMKEKAAEARYRETFTQTATEKQKDRDARMAELREELAGGKYDRQPSGGGSEKLSQILLVARNSLKDIESEILHLRPMLDSAMPGEKKAITDRIDALRAKKDYWRRVEIEDINLARRAAGLPMLEEPKEYTLEEVRNSLPPRKAPATVAAGPSTREKAIRGLQSLIPDISPATNAVKNAASKLKLSVNPMTGRPWTAEN